MYFPYKLLKYICSTPEEEGIHPIQPYTRSPYIPPGLAAGQPVDHAEGHLGLAGAKQLELVLEDADLLGKGRDVLDGDSVNFYFAPENIPKSTPEFRTITILTFTCCLQQVFAYFYFRVYFWAKNILTESGLSGE